MINDILNESFEVGEDASLDKLLMKKLKFVGLSKTQFEKLSGLQRRSLDGI